MEVLTACLEHQVSFLSVSVICSIKHNKFTTRWHKKGQMPLNDGNLDNRVQDAIKSSTMIQVKFFSSLKELTGHGELELNIQSPLTVREIWQRSTAKHALPANTLCAINMEYAKLDDIAQDNDEVAFFPPVTGG